MADDSNVPDLLYCGELFLPSIDHTGESEVRTSVHLFIDCCFPSIAQIFFDPWALILFQSTSIVPFECEFVGNLWHKANNNKR